MAELADAQGSGLCELTLVRVRLPPPAPSILLVRSMDLQDINESHGKEILMDVKDDRFCFVCGDRNNDGLQLEWNLAENESCLRTTFHPEKRFQGWKDILHGGIVATILDEIMVNHGVFTGNALVSVELTVRYRNPASIDEEIEFEGFSEPRKGKLFRGEAKSLQDGTLIAEATSKLMKVEADLRSKWEND